MAKDFLSVKSKDDDIKASHDIATIEHALRNVQPSFEYIQNCIMLHNTINEDYPEILEMHRVVSEMSSVLRYDLFDRLFEDYLIFDANTSVI